MVTDICVNTFFYLNLKSGRGVWKIEKQLLSKVKTLVMGRVGFIHRFKITRPSNRLITHTSRNLSCTSMFARKVKPYYG